jgi:hypothetical protein
VTSQAEVPLGNVIIWTSEVTAHLLTSRPQIVLR